MSRTYMSASYLQIIFTNPYVTDVNIYTSPSIHLHTGLHPQLRYTKKYIFRAYFSVAKCKIFLDVVRKPPGNFWAHISRATPHKDDAFRKQVARSKFSSPWIPIRPRKKFPSFMVYLMMSRYPVLYMSVYGHGMFKKRKKFRSIKWRKSLLQVCTAGSPKIHLFWTEVSVDFSGVHATERQRCFQIYVYRKHPLPEHGIRTPPI